MKKVLVIIGIITLIAISVVTVKVSNDESHNHYYSINVSVAVDSSETVESIGEEVYDMAIENLKEYEGYRGDPYYDTDGHLTIGYGHHIKFEDKFTYPMSEQTADSVLRNDFDKRVDSAYKIHGENLDYNKAIAIGMFIYNCGSSTYRKSSIRKKVDKGINPESTWIQYCNYTAQDGTVVFNEKLRERRLFEISLYNYYD